MAKKTKKTDTSELSSIKSRLFTRGASLVGMGLKTGVKAAELALAKAVSNRSKEELYLEFLIGRVNDVTKKMESLKGGFMKAGQLLSVYGEHFFPEEVNKILKRLQSDSKPVSFSQMEKVIVRALGKEKYESLDIDRTPVGAASMGQVYRVSVAGEDRALKVQYPGVAKAIDSDLKVIKSILSVLKVVPGGDQFDEIYEEIRRMLHREVAYDKELVQLGKYRELLEDWPEFVVPKAYSEFSTGKVLCMDFISGRRFDDPEVKSISQERRNRLGAAMLKLLFHEIFEWRRVQTDPHIGNFLVQLEEDGYERDRIVLLDFGAVRKLPKSYVDPFRKMALASISDDKLGIQKQATALGFLREDDPVEVQDLFARVVLKGTEPFQKMYDGDSTGEGEYSGVDYDWGKNEVVDELAAMAKDAIFSFKLRPPPREAVFVDRKLIGTAMILKTLGVKYGPRKLALKYLSGGAVNSALADKK